MHRAATIGASVATLAAIAWSGVAAPAPDSVHGAQVYGGQCALCHGVNGEGGQGPALQGVIGRKAGSTAFAYSDALKASGLVWDAAHLDPYLADPQKAVPGTVMPVKVEAAGDRADLIAYLAALKPVATRTAESRAPVVKNGEVVFADWRADAPGVRHRVTMADLPAPFATTSAVNQSRRGARPPGVMPKAPAGFTVSLYADGLQNPRAMRTAPNGDVFLSESAAGRIRVLRSAAGAGKATQSEVFADGLSQPFGIAFWPVGPNPKFVYVGEKNRVVRFPYSPGALKAGGPAEVVVAKLADTDGGHITRDLAFSADGKRLLVSVGSSSNVADRMPKLPLADAQAHDKTHGLGAGWGPEENRADVLEFDPGGKGGRIYAAGIRNCVGLAVQPGTGTVWCSTNERDGLGDDLVPDYVTRVKPGAFYGWPWWYLGDHEDPRRKDERPDLKGKVAVPDVLIQPHSASLGMVFHTGVGVPAGMKGALFAAEHGSWNRSDRTGYKVIRVLLKPDGSPTGAYEDFLTGFVLDDASVWGRPVGVTVAQDGALLVSDDGANVIWRVAYTGLKRASR